MATTNLPAIQHPLSRMDDPTNLNVRGLSRDGSRAASRQSLTFGQDKFNALRPITADQVPWRLTRSSNGFGGQNSPRHNSFAALGQIPEGVEVKLAEDPSKPSIPIFGECVDFPFTFYQQSGLIYCTRIEMQLESSFPGGFNRKRVLLLETQNLITSSILTIAIN